MKSLTPLLLSFLLAVTIAGAGAAEGLVADYTFSEGAGSVLKDASGNGNDARIYGAQWVKLKEGYALKFDGISNFVDCGAGPAFDLKETCTLEAWISPEIAGGEPGIMGKTFETVGLSYYKGNCYWYVSSGGHNLSTAFDQPAGDWYHVVATFDGKTMNIYMNGELRTTRASKFDTIKSGGNFFIGCTSSDTVPEQPGGITGAEIKPPPLKGASYFPGKITGVRVYSRAILPQEVQARYKVGAARVGRDTQWFDRVCVTLYPYYSEKRILASADLRGFLPVPADARLEMSLARKGGQPLSTRTIDKIPDTKLAEADFSLADVSEGEYEIMASVSSDGRVVSMESAAFAYPPAPVTVPSPGREAVGNLPTPSRPVEYGAEVLPGGGLNLQVGGKAFQVRSSFSYPNAGDNTLAETASGEQNWQVRANKDGRTCVIEGIGRYYSIKRVVTLDKHRLYFKDTFTNRYPEPVGIIVRNTLDTKDTGVGDIYIGGYKSAGTGESRHNPTVFVSTENLGLGLIALDDVYRLQIKQEASVDASTLLTDCFMVEAGKSYTMEWALYLNGAGDYYDFINAVRDDEGLNGKVTIEGGFAFIGRGSIPTQEFIDLRELKYSSVGCLSRCTDDPGISIEGIEFKDFPKEMEVIRNQFGEIKAKYPHLYRMFHIAHSLYATDRPQELFPDSMVVDPTGYQATYGSRDDIAYYSNYFSKERVDQGWRWYIFYPTMTNSFGKAMLESVDQMVDQMNCSGAFMDGFMYWYGSDYTYDITDGHSADIDPDTKTIKRQKANVVLVSQECQAEFARRMKAKGAVVIANGGACTRTLAKEDIIWNLEVYESPQSHLWPSTACLGNSGNIKNEADIYRDVRGKLNMANLYFYYGESDRVTHKSVPAYMYPFTVQELHSGYVKGVERLITLHPGIYGWSGDSDLHLTHLFDARGALADSSFLTTADSTGVRTRLDLEENQTAVLKRIPVSLNTKSPVNALARQYDAQGIRLALNGSGRVTVTVRSGDFKITPGTVYTVTAGKTLNVKADSKSQLVFPLDLNGQTELVIGGAR